jgi:hypothetical protein
VALSLLKHCSRSVPVNPRHSGREEVPPAALLSLELPAAGLLVDELPVDGLLEDGLLVDGVLDDGVLVDELPLPVDEVSLLVLPGVALLPVLELPLLPDDPLVSLLLAPALVLPLPLIPLLCAHDADAKASMAAATAALITLIVMTLFLWGWVGTAR